MMVLFDIGNTNIKILVNGKISFYSNDSFTNLPEELSNLDDGTKIYVSYVNKKSFLLLRDLLIKRYGTKVHIIEINPLNTKSMVNIEDSMKKELGSDIYFALNSSIKSSQTFLNIDFGTALTFNLVINSKYVGCGIMPGVYTSYNALISKASLLKEVELDKENTKVLGLNTKEAINSGIIMGYASLVDEYIRRIKEDYKLDNLDIYVTGGAYNLVFKYLKTKVIYKEDLVFNGMLNIIGE